MRTNVKSIVQLVITHPPSWVRCLGKETSTDCGVCIGSCPYSKPPTLHHAFGLWLAARGGKFPSVFLLWMERLIYGDHSPGDIRIQNGWRNRRLLSGKNTVLAGESERYIRVIKKEASVMTDARKSKERTPNRGRLTSKGASRKKFAIDLHAHIVFPETTKFSRKHVVSMTPPKEVLSNPVLLRRTQKWREKVEQRFSSVKTRLRDMDKAGIDIQVLTPSLVHHYTYWADPEKSLKIEQSINERIAEIVHSKPDRFVGLGGVPLQHTAKAVGELERCVNDLGLRGVQISSSAGSRELGDRRLFPFWKKAEELGALIYIHPAGITDARYKKFDLWNSIGQPLEEAMAMAFLFYEGVLDRFPKLKICVAHGGGYLPFYTGRVDRNYRDKPHLRFNMSKSPSQYLRHFYYDSCVYNIDMLEFLVKKIGAGRIVLGSDYPVGESDPVGFVHKSRQISATDKENIIWRNAAGLLNIPV